jgi:hypothetical protein
MNLSQKTRAVLRDLFTTDDERRAERAEEQAANRLSRATDRFDSTVGELLECMKVCRHGSPHH